ncbi:hypothetical protein C8J57DRAFT_1259178 [Mycena rebaudengoi]|nr:hypothetical protein C8J57DRAFT_1259178 [Mycena rebaudengoi]
MDVPGNLEPRVSLRKTPVSPPLVALLANANALRRTGPTVFLLRAGDVPRMLSACTRDAEGATRRAGAGSGTTYAWSSRGCGLGNARKLVNIGPARLIVGSHHLRLVVSHLIRLGAPFAIVIGISHNLLVFLLLLLVCFPLRSCAPRSQGSSFSGSQEKRMAAIRKSVGQPKRVRPRALDIDPRSIQLWLSYSDMELKSHNVQHARNLFDGAVTLLLRVDQLWYKNVYLEELPQNVPGMRQAYIKLEERYDELDRANTIYERWVAFEEERSRLDKAHEVFQTALEFYGGDQELIQNGVWCHCKMEMRLKEYERTRMFYKFALERIPRSKSAQLYAAYTKLEKQHGTRSMLDNTVLGNTTGAIMMPGSTTRLGEGVWQDLKDKGVTVEEEAAAAGRIREVYKCTVLQVPPSGEKRHWRRYIFLWLDYVLFEEIETKVGALDYARAHQIYQTVLTLVPYKQFTFAKLWLMFAKFEIWWLDLTVACKVLGTAIGMCHKEVWFKGYIELEVELREFDRAWTLHGKYLEVDLQFPVCHLLTYPPPFDPANSPAWIKCAELEGQLQDCARMHRIFELGVAQSPLSMPELL